MHGMGLVAAALLLAASPAATVKLPESGQAAVAKIAPSFGGWHVSGKKVLTFDKLRLEPTPAILLLTFGASWCHPCREGLPRLKAFSLKHPELRLVLVDVEAEQEKAQAFANEMGVDLALHDKFEKVAETYGLKVDGKLSLPRTFLIAANGRVQAIYREEGPDLEQVIEGDLAALQAAKQP